MQAITTRPTRNRQRIEPGAFQKDIACVIDDTGVLTAHDAGQRQRACLIGDQQHVIVQHNLLAIQQGQLFPGLRPTYMDRATELSQVKGLDFEAVDVSSLMMYSNSGQVRTYGYHIYLPSILKE